MNFREFFKNFDDFLTDFQEKFSIPLKFIFPRQKVNSPECKTAKLTPI